jgi:hypothetical protein
MSRFCAAVGLVFLRRVHVSFLLNMYNYEPFVFVGVFSTALGGRSPAAAI